MSLYYGSHSRFYVSVDCIIFGLKEGKLSILLTRRAFEPEKGKWSLMGGFVRPDESVDAAAKRVLYELTGLHDVYMRQVGAFGSIDRDPGERVVSVAYFALLDTSRLSNDLIAEHGAVWVNLDSLPELGFDHPEMIAKGRDSPWTNGISGRASSIPDGWSRPTSSTRPARDAAPECTEEKLTD